ncbi:hypothetical protein CTKZ_35560 [Cellulomonas algicola]|uniref:DUF3027 domain-containing protein n=1 Tax=Cellulomonas algicola TaxID=2071633 RepID=A0A401V512_9CELL|nr:DUF3027 domain-containing protein [Cellulomonas algicola]GCD21994.1 hypothetical protein CTKZ_35560 [Cellulomonas algicola]
MAVATKDAVLGNAVDLAREVAIGIAEDPADVGEHLGHVVEGERLVSHRFACLARGYRGWEWTVTVARVPRGRTPTVCEAELLPGDDAILAATWVPWSERLRPGDIGPGDVLPFRADDPRLEPGWTPTGDDELDSVAIDELALARARVLSPQGRDEAAERWYRGSHGPTTAGALAASAACASCGFLVTLQGSLGTVFGVCANEWSPDDGKVVSLDHGCGAHSETEAEAPPSDWPAPDPLIDEMRVEVVPHAAPVPAADEVVVVEAAAGEAVVVEAGADETVVVVPAAADEAHADGAVADEAGADEGVGGEAAADEVVVEPAVAAELVEEALLEEPVARDDAPADVPAAETGTDPEQ